MQVPKKVSLFNGLNFKKGKKKENKKLSRYSAAWSRSRSASWTNSTRKIHQSKAEINCQRGGGAVEAGNWWRTGGEAKKSTDGDR